LTRKWTGQVGARERDNDEEKEEEGEEGEGEGEGEGEEEGGISLWGGLWFLSGAYQDGTVLSGTHQDGQERIRMGGSCQERIRMVRSASGWEGPVRTCQDDQDDQENQNPVRRPPGSWHPNKMLMN
jgi:hypothetical protein